MKKRELIQQFKRDFCGKVDNNVYRNCVETLVACVTLFEQMTTQSEAVNSFSYSFNNLKNSVLFSRNTMKATNDELNKNSSLIEKIKTRKECNKADRLCNKVLKFERKFEEVFGFSLNDVIIENVMKNKR